MNHRYMHFINNVRSEQNDDTTLCNSLGSLLQLNCCSFNMSPSLFVFFKQLCVKTTKDVCLPTIKIHLLQLEGIKSCHQIVATFFVP